MVYIDLFLELLSKPIVRGTIGAILVVSLTGLAFLFLAWMERKVIARLQVRYGPNRAGKFGILQTVADGIKMFLKEDIINEKADKAVFTLAPILAFGIAFLPFVAIPFSENLIASDLNIGILYIIAVASLSTVAVIMAGWGPNNKYNLLGGMRAAAQMISYEIPLGLSVIGVVALTGSLSTVAIANAQSGTILGIIPKWFIFLQPLGFIVFIVAAFAESARIPFDLAEAEQELVAGWTTEFSGMKFGLLLFAEYVHMILASLLTVILFLGGWSGPVLPGIPVILQQLFYLFSKTLLLIFIFMWVRATLPRVRIDQLLAIGWKVLIPIALLNIAITGFGMVILG